MLEKLRNFVLRKRRSFIRKSVHFGIVLRLQELGHNGRPTQGMAPITWACLVIVETGPETWAHGFLSGRQSLASTGDWAPGPNCFGPSIGF